MKKILMILALLCICFANSFAQEAAGGESKSEAIEFLSRDGVLLNKDFHEIGTVAGIEFESLIITDVVSGKRTGCLRIETSYSSSAGGTDTVHRGS